MSYLVTGCLVLYGCDSVTMMMVSKWTNTAKKHPLCFHLARINFLCRVRSYSVTSENKLLMPSYALFSDWREQTSYAESCLIQWWSPLSSPSPLMIYLFQWSSPLSSPSPLMIYLIQWSSPLSSSSPYWSVLFSDHLHYRHRPAHWQSSSLYSPDLPTPLEPSTTMLISLLPPPLPMLLLLLLLLLLPLLRRRWANSIVSLSSIRIQPPGCLSILELVRAGAAAAVKDSCAECCLIYYFTP